MLLLASLSACCNLGFWREEIFVSEAPFHVYSPPEKTQELDKYFLGNAFVKVYVLSTNPNMYESESPYYFGVSLIDGEDYAQNLIVHNVIIHINGILISGHHYLEGGIEDNRTYLTPFTLERHSSTRGHRLFFYTSPIKINHSETTRIDVVVDLEAVFSSGTKREVIMYSFYPEVKSGFIGECI